MAAYFIDSSALVKRYVAERGSGWVKASVVPTAGNRIYVSRVTSVEVVLVLVSADLELNTAAAIEGLTVIDPQ